MKSKLKLQKGFTIIELIVVIAILGILVLLAMWGYKGYVEKAKLVQIRHDVKAAEQLLAREYLAKDTSLPDNWVDTNPQDSVNNIYDTRGPVNHDDVEPGNYKLFPKDEIGSKLPGDFHAKDDGKVYYEDKVSSGDSEDDFYVEQPPLTEDEIADLIDEGFIPVATADELQRINGLEDENGDRIFEEAVWGAGTDYEGIYTGTLDSKYIQVKDIDLKSYENWIPIGVNPGAPFAGEYNGGNYLIDNLNIIEKDIDVNSAGLFGSVSNGDVIISNIKMRNVNVDVNNSSMLIGDVGLNGETTLSIMNIDIEGNISGSGYSGGLIGFIYGDEVGRIKNIRIKGDISSNDSSAGGLIGHNNQIVDINKVSITGNVTGYEGTGGLIGEYHPDNNRVSNISAISINGNIKSIDNKAGGIIGGATTAVNINNVDFRGSVEGKASAGGLIGQISASNETTISSVVINGNIIAIDESAGGIIGISTAQIDIFKDITIENSNIKALDSGCSAGIIGKMSDQDIELLNIELINNQIVGTNKVAGLIGDHKAQGNFENINITGSIIGVNVVAGLIAEPLGTDMYETTNIKVSANISGQTYVGMAYGKLMVSAEGVESIEGVDFTGTTISGNGINEVIGGW